MISALVIDHLRRRFACLVEVILRVLPLPRPFRHLIYNVNCIITLQEGV